MASVIVYEGDHITEKTCRFRYDQEKQNEE